MPKIPVPELREIEWLDSGASSHGWQTAARVEKMKPEHVISVGYVFDEDAKTVRLVESLTLTNDPDWKNVGCMQSIDKGNIRRSTRLRGGRSIKA